MSFENRTSILSFVYSNFQLTKVRYSDESRFKAPNIQIPTEYCKKYFTFTNFESVTFDATLKMELRCHISLVS